MAVPNVGSCLTHINQAQLRQKCRRRAGASNVITNFIPWPQTMSIAYRGSEEAAVPEEVAEVKLPSKLVSVSNHETWVRRFHNLNSHMQMQATKGNPAGSGCVSDVVTQDWALVQSAF